MVETKGFEPLLNNFYEQIDEGYSIICDFLKDGGSKAADVQQFMNLSFDKPEEIDEIKIWERTKDTKKGTRKNAKPKTLYGERAFRERRRKK